MDDQIRISSINRINEYVKNKRQSKVIENSISNFILENISYDLNVDSDDISSDIFTNLYDFVCVYVRL